MTSAAAAATLSPAPADDAPAPYRGRFAPSPTGPLHAGSLVSALASYLDARAHRGAWLVRIEDVDGPRSVRGMAEHILHTLAVFGMHADAEPWRQSERDDAYRRAFDRLDQQGLLYPCGCTRREIADSLSAAHQRNATLVYRGTCRDGLHGQVARAWRLRLPDGARSEIDFIDRWQGAQHQSLTRDVGDFVIRRADDQWAYQLAVVVDDAAAGITHVVRGADLLDSTPRQILLQRLLGYPSPSYMHVPVLNNALGEKLSKQNGATELALDRPLLALHAAAQHLGLPIDADAATLAAFYEAAIAAWAKRFGIAKTL